MVLNYIWVAFFAIALVVALVRLIFFGDTAVFTNIVTSTFDTSKTGFEISLGLTGVLTLWLGIMKIGEQGGAVNVLAKVMGPLFRRLFPGVPRDHPAHGSIVMNFAANMLGLGNAATPLGLKAMQELQSLNTEPDTATNAQIMFLVLNTSGLTLIPVSIMVFPDQGGDQRMVRARGRRHRGCGTGAQGRPHRDDHTWARRAGPAGSGQRGLGAARDNHADPVAAGPRGTRRGAGDFL